MALPDIFAGLNDIDAATARRRFHPYQLAPGELLTREGEAGHGLAFVIRGQLVVLADGVEVGRVGEGGVIGEMGLFDGSRRTATLRAVGPTEVWLLAREGYEALRDTLHPACVNLEGAIIAAQVGRLMATGLRIATLGLGRPPTTPPTSGLVAAIRRLFGAGDVEPDADADVGPALLASPLFGDAPPAAVAEIAQRFRPLACRQGALLCTEGERGDRMFVLDTGSVEVVIQHQDTPQSVAVLEPGAAFGMVSLAGRGERMASCVAREPSRVCELDAQGWRALVTEPFMVGSTFRRAVIRAFAAQLDYSNTQLAAAESAADRASGAERLRSAQRALHTHDRLVAPGR